MAAGEFEYLASEQTPIGLIALRRRELLGRPGTVVTEVTIDHAFLMSSYITTSERALATRALDWHGGTGLDVLVGGLGLGYTAAEVLASERVASVEVVEFLPAVIGWCRDGLIPLSATLAGAGDRLRIAEGDVYGRLAAPAGRRHDLILIDVDHAPDAPLDASTTGFYTEAGLRAAREHLADGGILAVWSAAESSAFADVMRTVFREVRIAGVPIDNDVTDEQYTDWLFLGRR